MATKNVFPAVALDGIAAVAGDAVTGPHDAHELFNIDVKKFAGMVTLVTHRGRWRHQIAPAAQTRPTQDARDGGAGQAGALGDMKTGELLTTQRDDLLLAPEARGLAQTPRPRGTIPQARPGSVPDQPFGHGARRHPEGRRSGLQGVMFFQDKADHLLSTQRSKNGMVMDVHGVA